MLEKFRTPKAKKILKIGAVSIILLILIGRILLPVVVKKVIQSVGSSTLGVPVTVENVDLSIFAGSGTIKGLAIASPEGFSETPFISVESAGGNIGLMSLLGEPITIQWAKANGVKVHLEVTKEGKQNLRTFAEKFLPPTPPDSQDSPAEIPSTEATDPAPEAAPMMAILVELVEAKDVEVTVTDDFAMPGKSLTTATRFSNVEIRNIFLPAPGAEGPWDPMTLSVQGFQLDAPSWYQEPQILNLNEASVSIDVALAMSTLAKPKVELPTIEAKGLRLVAETEIIGDIMMNAPLESLHAFLNATSLEDPTLYEPEEIEGDDEGLMSGLVGDSGEMLNNSVGTASNAIGSLFGKKKDTPPSEDPPATPVPSEATETSPTEEPAELPLEYVLLTKISASDIQVEYIEHKGENTEKTAVNIATDITSVIYPNPDNISSDVKVSIRSVPDNEGTMEVTAKGNLVEIGKGKQLDVTFNTEKFPLPKLKGITGGNLDTAITITVKDSVLSGGVDFRLNEFNFDSHKISRTQIATYQTIKLIINNRSTPNVVIPPTPLDKSSPKQIFANILGSIISSSTDVTGSAKDALNSAVLKNTKDLLNNNIIDTDTAKDKVFGLFGKKTKDEE
jgi:hypothetical protein